MGTATLPNVNQVGANDWEDVEGNDRALRDEINGNLENVNIKSTAAIAYSKLATLSTGQLIVGNAGVPTATTLSGDVTISAAGALTIANNAINNAKMADNSVDSAEIVAGGVDAAHLSSGAAFGNLAAGEVTDAKLASPNNSTYKTILTVNSIFGVDTAAGTYIFTPGQDVKASGAAVPVSGNVTFAWLYFDDADYTVGSLTQKLRLRFQVATNATAPAITFTAGLYPFTVAGAADNVTPTLGSVVAGSTVAIASPGASAITQGNSGDFTIPADGGYALGVVTSGTIANNSGASLAAQLQTRNTA